MDEALIQAMASQVTPNARWRRWGDTTRRQLLAVMAGTAVSLVAAIPGRAEVTHRIGYLHAAPGPIVLPPLAEALADLGYVQGRSISIESRVIRGRDGLLADFVADLVGRKVEIIIAAGNPAIRAAKMGTRTIPIIMAPARFPIEHGFIDDIARPGRNITGVILDSSRDVQLRLDALLEIAPRIRRLALLTVDDSDDAETSAVNSYASTLGINVSTVMMRSGHVEAAFVAINEEKADGLYVGHGSLLLSAREIVVGLAAAHGLPAVWQRGLLGDDAALLVVSSKLTDLNTRIASFVHQIINGAKPSGLPAQTPPAELVINLKTANTLGLTIPRSLLQRADRLTTN